MKFADFKKELESGKNYSVYYLEGEDIYFLERGLLLLKKQLNIDETLNYSVFSNEEINLESVGGSLLSVSFFGGNRLTVLKEYYPKENEIKKLNNLILELPSDSTLAIINSKKCDGIKKLDKTLTIDCGKGDANLLVRWIQAECKQKKVEIDSVCAKMIVEYCLQDMVRIANETNKLICFVGEGGKIYQQDIEDNVAKENDFAIYELTNYVARKKTDLALSVIKDFLSKGETPQRLVSSIYNYFRRLLHASISNLSVEELSKTFGIKEQATIRLKEQSKLFKIKDLKNAVDMLADMDYKIKSGNIDAYDALNVIVFNIMK